MKIPLSYNARSLLQRPVSTAFTALGIALVVAVTVEITANPLGLGYRMTIAQQSLQPDLMFALLLWIGLLGWSLNALLVRAEARLFGAAA